ncbi:hypothetical protein E2C01_093077 [Portunus trituberculatus]|uniref:Uncharacterized protein n=1 Tax=Portunus trituberculatus TaxID=210409 RepID=A0A5B7JXN9_PORTR|nr:hypothetical protein [Portunus trituberculatus]
MTRRNSNIRPGSRRSNSKAGRKHDMWFWPRQSSPHNKSDGKKTRVFVVKRMWGCKYRTTA